MCLRLVGVSLEKFNSDLATNFRIPMATLPARQAAGDLQGKLANTDGLHDMRTLGYAATITRRNLDGRRVDFGTIPVYSGGTGRL